MDKLKLHSKREIAFERVLFFSDAVVAIAITLLALDLKLNLPGQRALTFRDLLGPWHQYLAFILSFVNIASFWRTHHDFFTHINKMDDRVLFFNTCWLFLIVTLPFCTSLLSTHFGDAPAVFLYSLNVFFISVVQNIIWDYSCKGNQFIDEARSDAEYRKLLQVVVNIDMFNGLLALILSFFFPKTAFFILFFKLPTFVIGAFYVSRLKRLGRIERSPRELLRGRR